MKDLVEKVTTVWDRKALVAELAQASAKMVEQAARIEQLERALNNIGMYTYPRVPGEYEDECTHEITIGRQVGLNHDCHDCMAAYARAALEEK